MNRIAESIDGAGTVFTRISSGDVHIDEILGGGFPENSINLVMGQPGTGKTIFAEQLIFHNISDDRPILYLTTLSEPLAKVVKYLQGFQFYREERLGTSVIYEDVGAELIEKGIGALAERVNEAIRTISPKIIVIDSFRAIHDLCPTATEIRRLVYELAGQLSAYDTTTFLLGEYNEDDIQRYPEFAVADSILELSRRKFGARDERFLRVFKLRGSRYQEGAHAFEITSSGLHVYPRLVSPKIPLGYQPIHERTSSGVAELDTMVGGGFWRGSTTVVAGPSGSGKTTLALQFALEGRKNSEPCLYINFQENPTQLARAVNGLGFDLEGAVDNGLEMLYKSPVELQIDSILGEVFDRIRRGVRRVVIDAVGDLATSASDPQRMHDYLYALVQHFAANRVTTVLTVETFGKSTTGDFFQMAPISYMSDNVILLEMGGEKETKRTVRILKTRGSPHDPRVREVTIGSNGFSIG